MGGLVLYWTRRIWSHISCILPWITGGGGQKWEIWPRFLIPGVFTRSGFEMEQHIENLKHPPRAPMIGLYWVRQFSHPPRAPMTGLYWVRQFSHPPRAPMIGLYWVRQFSHPLPNVLGEEVRNLACIWTLRHCSFERKQRIYNLKPTLGMGPITSPSLI